MVQPWVGKHDTFGTGVIVLSPEDDSERYARRRADRVRLIAAMDGNLDDLVAAWIELRPDRLLRHRYLAPLEGSNLYGSVTATGGRARGSIS